MKSLGLLALLLEKEMKSNLPTHQDCELSVVDVSDENGKKTYTVKTTGFKKEDLKVELENSKLYITAENKSETEQSFNFNHVRLAIQVGDIAESDVQAKFEEGFLLVSVPGKSEKKTGIQIN